MAHETDEEVTAVERPLRPLVPEANDDRLDPVALATGYRMLATDNDL